MKTSRISFLFIATALVALLAGLFAGVIGSFQYILPEFLKEVLPFNKTRPIHVSLVITWIFTAALGGVYYYLPQIGGRKLYSMFLAHAHLVLLLLTGVCILIAYLLGYFGGREYLEFPPIFALPMLLTWLLFTVNFIFTINWNLREWPVYMWMWATGVLFFLITFGESYMWKFAFFGNDVVRDMTVQWKANGSMVGSWNMLIYGTAFYVMEKISGDKKLATVPSTFFFYFLGLANLMFNWGHHTYIIPAAPWIKNTAYIISMTELLILGNIIRNWSKTVSASLKHIHFIPYRFLMAADVWIFLNLILAILLSIPAVNQYTHGTHITVAHAMGTTIGINSMLLLASIFYILSLEDSRFISANLVRLKLGLWLSNISLLVFWIALLAAGITKAVHSSPGEVTNFQALMHSLSVVFELFTFAGIGLLIGFFILVIPAIKSLLAIKSAS